MEKLHATVKRPLTLFSVTAWQQGYSTYIQDAFDWNYSVYFYFDGVNVNFYHTEKDFEHFKKVVALQLI